MHMCDEYKLVCVTNKHFIWNFPHVPNSSQDLTLKLRPTTNASMSQTRLFRNYN